jgi:hypothetical protein
MLGGPAQSSRQENSSLSGKTPHKVGEEKSKESKSESGDFGHDHFLPPSPPIPPFRISVIILRQLANQRSSGRKQFNSLQCDDRRFLILANFT